PVEINLVSYAAPIAAAITGFLLLAEVPTPATAVGFVAVLAGFALVKRAALRRELRRLGR
ncbi:MAG: EamA/RhaT family transporter, partial [Haloferacaceae archaeon]